MKITINFIDLKGDMTRFAEVASGDPVTQVTLDNTTFIINRCKLGRPMRTTITYIDMKGDTTLFAEVVNMETPNDIIGEKNDATERMVLTSGDHMTLKSCVLFDVVMRRRHSTAPPRYCGPRAEESLTVAFICAAEANKARYHGKFETTLIANRSIRSHFAQLWKVTPLQPKEGFPPPVGTAPRPARPGRIPGTSSSGNCGNLVRGLQADQPRKALLPCLADRPLPSRGLMRRARE